MRKTLKPILLLFVISLTAQTQIFAKNSLTIFVPFKKDTVKIGQQISDNHILGIKNYSKPTIKLSDFKGKLIILDFWSTWCSYCIESMPKMEALQNQFKGKVQVILVTTDSQSKIDKLRSEIVRKIHLPMIVGDTVLAKMFVFHSVPLHVWIDPNGKIVQITDGYNTSAKNIQSFFDGINPKFHFKHDAYKWDSSTPVWLDHNGALAYHLEKYSYFMNNIDEIGQGGYGCFRDSATKKINRLLIYNDGIADMYAFAFNGDTAETYSHPNRVILAVKNPDRYVIPKKDEDLDAWIQKNYYTYELKVPTSQSAQIFEIMKQDLNSFFRVYGKIEKRLVKCLVLKRTSTFDKLKTAGGRSYQQCDELGFNTKIRNKTISASIVARLTNTNDTSPMPILDGTGYTENIDIDIHANLNDLSSVKKELQKYDLDLVEEYKSIDMLVLTDIAK